MLPVVSRRSSELSAPLPHSLETFSSLRLPQRCFPTGMVGESKGTPLERGGLGKEGFAGETNFHSWDTSQFLAEGSGERAHRWDLGLSQLGIGTKLPALHRCERWTRGWGLLGGHCCGHPAAVPSLLLLLAPTLYSPPSAGCRRKDRKVSLASI